ncbi:hypothetical protein I3679_017355 [Proteus mirabilis]|uniref:Uncharacterized protein n=1 Tax=Proteus mirabilis TaxID=584 RepID=A0ABD5LY62_PROMI
MNKTWRHYFIDRGINDDLLDQYVIYADNLEKNGLPVIFEVEHLSNLVGIKYPEINNLIFGTKSFYREFKIPKRRGDIEQFNLLTHLYYLVKNGFMIIFYKDRNPPMCICI